MTSIYQRSKYQNSINRISDFNTMHYCHVCELSCWYYSEQLTLT